MSEKDLNLEENVDLADLSAISLDDESLEGVDLDAALDNSTEGETADSTLDGNNIKLEAETQWNSTIDEKVFLDNWDTINKNVLKDWDKFWVYLRWFFASAIVTLLWLLAIALLYSFSTYIKEASKITPNQDKQEFIDWYKEKLKTVKSRVWKDNFYTSPTVWSPNEATVVNEIVNASDIDYIEKKDLLSKYASDLVRSAEDKANKAESLKQDIAKQWFLPEELEILLSEDQAIDTIQRSLNALEVIKFSTATKVFSYMNTALTTISEMIRVSWASIENLKKLFVQLSSRWEKDISSYVYMCYLNPFEVNANCDTVWDLDLYYKIAKDNSIDIRLFKNSMNAISQLLEKEDSSLFSITFNWFNAEDKSIQFNIEVFTTQEDERALIAQWKRNPNIFILTNIINLLKQSSFIIWADINIKEINVDTKSLDQWNVVRTVNYSTMDFTVPIQKNTEREIFDYIDLQSMKKLLSERWFTQSLKYADESDVDENKENLDERNENNVNEDEKNGDNEDNEDNEMWEISEEEALWNEELNREESDQESWKWVYERSQEETSDQ